MSFLLVRCSPKFRSLHNLLPWRSSSSLGFKPGEHSRHLESLESLAHRDLTLFRYEAPSTVFKKNALALAMVPVWTYLAKVSWGLKADLEPYSDTAGLEGRKWVLENVTRASGGVAVGFFLFGCLLSGYWVCRTMNTVRRLVLRKGGKHVTLVTYGVLGRGSSVKTVPVSHCSAVHKPFYGKHRFFLRIKDHMFKYQFNLEQGTFSNKPLFDKTVGLRRRV